MAGAPNPSLRHFVDLAPPYRGTAGAHLAGGRPSQLPDGISVQRGPVSYTHLRAHETSAHL
eukprot:12287088-Alexandrium_andersonii.AAC.1